MRMPSGLLSSVSGPRDGVLDPELSFMDPLPVLDDPSRPETSGLPIIPASSYSMHQSRLHGQYHASESEASTRLPAAGTAQPAVAVDIDGLDLRGASDLDLVDVGNGWKQVVPNSRPPPPAASSSSTFTTAKAAPNKHKKAATHTRVVIEQVDDDDDSEQVATHNKPKESERKAKDQNNAKDQKDPKEQKDAKTQKDQKDGGRKKKSGKGGKESTVTEGAKHDHQDETQSDKNVSEQGKDGGAEVVEVRERSVEGAGAGADYIVRPIEGLKFVDAGRRERAWRDLAARMYAAQPAFMDRGKGRWNSMITYDPVADAVRWNGKPLPKSCCWKSTFDHKSEHAPGAKVTSVGQVVLVLMVKNESKIIERALASFLDIMDGFIILDTGSTDNTRQLMWDFLVTKHKRKGAIYNTEWYDFGTNRSIILQLAHQRGDWLLLMDADYVMVKEHPELPNLWRQQLPALPSAPAWLLLKTTGSLDYSRPHLVRGAVRWCYVCRTHEYLSRSIHDKTTGIDFRQESYNGLQIDHKADGGSKADKMPRDMVLLLMDQMDDPKSERSPFYMANTLKQSGMPEWGLRAYKEAMNLCTWNEEMMCSAKGAFDCMFDLPTGPSQLERILAMALHGMTQNPERLEIPSALLRKLRNVSAWWPHLSHVASSLGAMFTHNVYPEHQKLFIERPEHDFGMWQELSICCFFNPMYFELGLYIAHKIPTLPSFEKQHVSVQEINRRNLQMYQQRLNEWRRKAVRATPIIRKRILEEGHRALARGRASVAKDIYERVLHPLILEEHVPEELLPADMDAERKAVNGLCDAFCTAAYHKVHRYSAWQNTRPLQSMPVAAMDGDHDRALACFQLGQCHMRINSAGGAAIPEGNGKHVMAAMHFIDALKWVPGHMPSMGALYELTHMKNSSLTRTIHYLMRLVSFGQFFRASEAQLRSLQAQVGSAAEPPDGIHTWQPPELPGTAWLVPIPLQPKRRNRTLPDPDLVARALRPAPAWAYTILAPTTHDRHAQAGLSPPLSLSNPYPDWANILPLPIAITAAAAS